MNYIKQAEFVFGSTNIENLPETGFPEVAFLGRSNVGKSTLINRLTKRKKLAHTSSTPGRTQELNFFHLNLTDKRISDLLLVDLPGFGFAKFSKEKRERLNKLTVDYITSREELACVCLLNDSRRTPKGDELAIQELCFNQHVPFLLVLTKVDKLKSSEKVKQIRKVTSVYGLQESDCLLTGEKLPVKETWERILSVI